MKKTWGKLFRRKSITETELKEDYPSDNESFTLEYERRRDRIDSRATPSDCEGLEDDAQEDWEYYSEYNVSFSSDDSIIDAFKENDVHNDKEFDDIFKQATREHIIHNERDRKVNSRRESFYPAKMTAYSTKPATVREPPKSPTIRERSNMFEHLATGGRRASCLPPVAEKAQDENSGRYATWNNGNAKRKQRRQHMQRRRARDNPSDVSDDESKFTVNLSLDELNDIIKKNINSAVKTMVTAKSKGKKKTRRVLSPSESMSTETETIFSGSSSHSTEVSPGMLNKQIKAQLDKDLLRGTRRQSQALGMLPDPDEVRLTSGHMTHFHPNLLQQVPKIVEIPPSPYSNRHTIHPEMQLSPYLNVMQPTSSHVSQNHQHPSQLPPPPPPPPPLPQVTFNVSPHGNYDAAHMQLPNYLNQDVMSNSLNANGELPPGTPSRLRARRHTLASLGTENLLSGLGENFETKLEQVSNVIRLLDNNISLGESLNSSQNSSTSAQPSNNSLQMSQGSNNVQQLTQPNNNNVSANTSTTPESNQVNPGAFGAESPHPITNVLAPVMSIAEQIKALTKKPEKKLKPGQIKMSECARTLLILTNIVFLISGCGLIGLGVWMMMDTNIETYFAILNVDRSSTDFKMICYALIGVGVFVTIIGFMGCCGGIKQNKCMLSVFIVTVAVITVAEAGLGAMVVLNLDSPSAIPIMSAIFQEVEGNLMALLKRSIVEKYAPDTMFGTTWDKVQINLECCGAAGPDDYKLSTWKNDTTNDLTIPETCCVLLSKTAEVPEPSNKLLCQMGTTGFFHDIGCYDTMVGWFKDNSTYILAGGISTLCIEIFSFIFALVICRKAHHDDVKYKDRPAGQQ